MSKPAAVLAIIAALVVTISILPASSVARPITAILGAASRNPIALPVVSEKGAHDEGVCKGLQKEDCLIRRTLEAHIDYIYSGDTKP